jgi:hypothetical protein
MKIRARSSLGPLLFGERRQSKRGDVKLLTSVVESKADACGTDWVCRLFERVSEAAGRLDRFPLQADGRNPMKEHARQVPPLRQSPKVNCFRGQTTSIYNNVRRIGGSSPRQPCSRPVLQHGRAPHTAHNFFAHLDRALAGGGPHLISATSSGQQMILPFWVGEQS